MSVKVVQFKARGPQSVHLRRLNLSGLLCIRGVPVDRAPAKIIEEEVDNVGGTTGGPTQGHQHEAGEAEAHQGKTTVQ